MAVSEKKKLIIFTTAYYPFVGGVETAIREVSRRLCGRFDIYIVTGRFSCTLAKREAYPEGTVIRVGIGSRFDKWLLPLLGWAAANGFQPAGVIRSPITGAEGNVEFLGWLRPGGSQTFDRAGAVEQALHPTASAQSSLDAAKP